ncbi:hypothetical protein SAMN05421539_103385 [Jannaschia seohaensis]|uniref:Uncharacterized protein n=1 Tax=Jannaschia seohaensis TaxID=475081 RepID=A0A2Y9BZN1_9RHOB|nr:hypothetical protein BCF38_103385 [Jannaschia seohaensis]SSA44662.1 hypothetical protein SAMN05421539_103385 [Jannaschia seohaensis]
MPYPVKPYESFEPLTLAAVALALSVVPVALAYATPPAIPEHVGAPGRLKRTAPLSVAGCFAIGLANGAFRSFAPIYADATAPTPLMVCLSISARIAGVALSQGRSEPAARGQPCGGEAGIRDTAPARRDRRVRCARASVHTVMALATGVALLRKPAVAEEGRAAFAALPPVGHDAPALAELRGALAETWPEPLPEPNAHGVPS